MRIVAVCVSELIPVFLCQFVFNSTHCTNLVLLNLTKQDFLMWSLYRQKHVVLTVDTCFKFVSLFIEYC